MPEDQLPPDLPGKKKVTEISDEAPDLPGLKKKSEPKSTPSPLVLAGSTSASTDGGSEPAGSIDYLSGANKPAVAPEAQQAFNQNFSLKPSATTPAPQPVVNPQDWQQGIQEAKAAGLALPKNAAEADAAELTTATSQAKKKVFDQTWAKTLLGTDEVIKTPEQKKQDSADAYGDPVYGKVLTKFNPDAIAGNENDIVNYLSTHKYYADKAYQGMLSQQDQFEIINNVASEKIASHEEAINTYKQAGVDKLADQYLDLVDKQQSVIQRANALGEEIKALQAKQTSSTGDQPKELNDKIDQYNKLKQEYDDIVTRRTPLDAAENEIRGYIKEVSFANEESQKVRNAVNSLPEVSDVILKKKLADQTYNAAEDIGTKLVNSVVSTANGLISFAPKFGGDLAKAVQGREGYGIGDKIVDLVTNNDAVPFIESDKYSDITKYNPLKSPGGFIRSLSGGMAQQLPVMVAIALTDNMVNPVLSKTYNVAGKIASIQKADAISTTLAGFINSYKQYSEESSKMGLDPRTGLAYSSAMAMLEGLSENIMPDKQLLTPAVKSKMLRQYVIDISKGASVADAAKKMTYNFVENGVKESSEEFAVMAGNYLAKKAIEVDNPDIKAELPSINEAINTFAIAFASAGAATILAEKRGIDTQKNLAYQSASRDIETTKAVLKNLVNERVITENEALNFIDKVNKFRKSEELVPSDISDVKKADIAYILSEIEAAKERLDNKNLAEPVAKSIEKTVSEKEKKIDEILNDNQYELDFNEALDKENEKIETPKGKENEDGSVEVSPTITHDPSDDADMLEHLSEVEKTMPLDEGETKLKQEIMARMAAEKQAEQAPENTSQPQQQAQTVTQVQPPVTVSQEKIEVKKPDEPAKEVKIDANQISELEKRLKQNQTDFYNEKISTLDYNKNKDALSEQLKQAKAGVLQVGEGTKNQEANTPSVSAEVKAPETKVEKPKIGFLSQKELIDLEKEIESNYVEPGDKNFLHNNNDIRIKLHNYDNPLATKTVNGVELRIADGLIRNKKKTYLLYADGKIVGEFDSVDSIKTSIKYIEDNLVKPLKIDAPTSESSKEAPAENKSPATEAVEAAPSEADVQEDTPKPKKEKVSKELIDEEEQKDSEKVDDPATMSKMNDDIEVLKKMPKEDLAEKKFLGMVERAFKAMDEGKISRSAYAKFKNDAKDILEGKVNKSAIDAKDTKMKVSRAMEKVKESLLGKGTEYKKLGYLSTGIPITPQMVADMIDAATKLAHRGIDAGTAIDVAVSNAINAIKKHPIYKKLVAAKTIDEAKFEKDVRAAVKENEEPAMEPEPKTEPEPKEKKKPSNEEAGITGEKRERASTSRIDDVKGIGDFRDVNLDVYDSVSIDKAEAYVNEKLNEFADKGLLVDLATEVLNDKSTVFPESLELLAPFMLADRLRTLAEGAETQMQKDTLNKLAAKVFDFYRVKATRFGQAQGVTAIIGKYMPKSRLGIEAQAREEMSRAQESYMNQKQKADVKTLTEAVNEVNHSEDEETFSRAVMEEVERVSGEVNGKDFVDKAKKDLAAIDGLFVDLTDC